MPEELIEEFWKSHPEIPRDEVYTTPDFYSPDTTDTESERIPLASDVSTVAENVKTNNFNFESCWRFRDQTSRIFRRKQKRHQDRKFPA